MNEPEVVRSLAALAQEVRLRVFRALVVAGKDGLTPGAISEQLGVASNTLSFHLKELAHAGLVSQERHGRNLVYLLRDSDIEVDVDLQAAIAAAKVATSVVGHDLPSALLRAGDRKKLNGD